MKTLRISPDLALPLDTVTNTLVAYGGKGMGKTNLGSVWAEELARCGLRWAWLDPLGVSWGLRHDAAGTGPGVECLILGGLHGDVPIEPQGGAAVADVVVEESTNVLIDFSRKASGEMWSIADKILFVTDYTLRLFQRQGEIVAGRRRPPLFQVLDEAARYIPQTIPSNEPQIARCVGAWNQLVEEGRNVSVGVGLLTQRSARLNKSVAELADAMIAFRTVGPNSLSAVLEWLGEHVEKGRAKELAEKVRSLERGHALVVSPGWLKFEGVIRVRMRETFDSSATVKHGERARTARGEGAKPNLQKIRERMAATIERAKAEDPKELRRQLAEMRAAYQPLAADLAPGEGPKQVLAALHRLKAAKPAPAAASGKVREVPVLKDAQVKRLEVLAGRWDKALAHYEAIRDDVQRGLNAVNEAAGLVYAGAREIKAALAAAQDKGERGPGRDVPGRPVPGPAPSVSRPAPVVPRAPRVNAEGNGRRPGPEQRVLDALAWWELAGVRTPSKIQAGFIAGYRVSKDAGGTFGNVLGKLRSGGLIEYPAPGLISATAAGRAEARAPEDEPSTAALQRAILDRLDRTESRVLSVLIEAYPGPLRKQEAGARAGYQVSADAGGTFGNILGRLRSLGLIEYPRPGEVVAQAVLFLEGA